MKQTTWFTKGLRRFGVCSIALILNARNKRPDLRRDCDSVYLFIPCVIIQQETNDLIYEGIATLLSRLYLSGMALSWNKRPDLRRDCDRLLLSSWTITGSPCETNDLIYEGIATEKSTWHIKECSPETNDLIYEGIATVLSVARSFVARIRNKRPERKCETKDASLEWAQ